MTPSGPDQVGDWRLKLYVTQGAVTLSRALPVLQTLGADVLDERPFEVRRSEGEPSRIYDFGLTFPVQAAARGAADDELRSRMSEAFIASWSGRAEVDGLNQLVLAAGLTWREVAVLRAYAHYLRQIGTPYTQRYVEQVLSNYPAIIADLAGTVRGAVRSGPVHRRPRASGRPRSSRIAASITRALDAVTSLDADRILRTLLSVISATTRTNEYRTGRAGQPARFPVRQARPGQDPRRAQTGSGT